MTIHTTGDLIRDYLRYNFPGQYVVVVKMNDGQLLKALLMTNERLQLTGEQYVDALHFGYALFVFVTEDSAFSIFEEFPKSVCHASVFGPDLTWISGDPDFMRSKTKERLEGCFLTEN